MAKPESGARISPPLMFAFRDAHRQKDARKKIDNRDETGTRVIASRRSLRAAVSEPELRRHLSRDLDNLMNTVNLGSVEKLDDLPFVRSSILNYGLYDIVNRTIDEGRTDSIVDEIRIAIGNFEPRIIRDTIRVNRDRSADLGLLKIRFLVAGEMACDPVAVPVEFVADLEMASGKITVSGK